MSNLCLYKSCLQRVAFLLRDGYYKSSSENPLSLIPSNIVDDLMSSTMDLQRSHGFVADDFQLFLTCGRLRELKIDRQHVDPEENHEEWDSRKEDVSEMWSRLFYFLKSGCHELEVLHLTGLFDYQVEDILELKPDLSEALKNFLRKTPNLKDLHCCFIFDLKALRNCKKLREVKLHFWPEQHWYDFLAKESGEFQPHEYLKLFSVCHFFGPTPLPYHDVVIILRHCPQLTSLGSIESLGVFSLLRHMNISPELKLRHCYWKDWKTIENLGMKILEYGEVRNAALHYPLIEKLDFISCSSKSMRCLRYLRNLVYLNIREHYEEVSENESFRLALEAIGPQLKHLSIKINGPVDISLLQYCPNLESLGIRGNNYPISASSVVHLPYLQRLSLTYTQYEDVNRIFPQISGCNQLTDLFMTNALNQGISDESMYTFLKRNSLSNLKVAYFKYCSLSERGFREFLRNAPQLERVEIYDNDLNKGYYERVIRETSHKAICNKGLVSEFDEYFEKNSAAICFY